VVAERDYGDETECEHGQVFLRFHCDIVAALVLALRWGSRGGNGYHRGQ